MKKKKIIATIIALVYFITILILGFGVMDDYFFYAFPSWPILVACIEDCSYGRVIFAVILNSFLLWLFIIVVLSLLGKIFSLFQVLKAKIKK